MGDAGESLYLSPSPFPHLRSTWVQISISAIFSPAFVLEVSLSSHRFPMARLRW